MTDPHRRERTFSHDYPPRGPRVLEEPRGYDSYKPSDQSLPRDHPRSRATAQDYFEPYSPALKSPSRKPPSLKWESEEFKSRDRHKSISSTTGGALRKTSPIASNDSRPHPRRSDSTSSANKSEMIKSLAEIPSKGLRSQSKDKVKLGNDDRDSSRMDLDGPSSTRLSKPSKVETLRIDTQAKKFKHVSEDGRSNLSSKFASDPNSLLLLGFHLRSLGPKPPTAYMGPLQRNAGDSGLTSPAMSSGNATPRSAAVIDVPKSNLGTIHSSASTTTNRTPVTFAVPLASVDGAVGHLRSDTSDTQKLLFGHFSSFTHSVSEIASVTVQRDLSRTAVERKEKEYERWQVHGGDFSALSEEQSRELQHRKAIMAQLDQKLKSCEQDRNHAVKAIVSSILVTGTTQTSPLVESDSTKVRDFENQLAEVKHEIQSLKASKELTQGSRRERQSSDTESRWALLGTDLDRIRSSIQTARTDLGLWKGIQEDVTHMKSQILFLQSRDVEQSSSVNKDIADLRQEIKVMKNLHQSLRDVVTREDHADPGLLQQVQLQKRETEEIQQQISKIEEKIGSLSDTSTTHNLRIESLEASKTSEQLIEVTTQANMESARVNGELQRLRSEQEEKDDLVGQEVERLDKAIISMQNNLEEAAKNLGNKFDLVEATNTMLSRRITAQESKSSDYTGQPQPNGVHTTNRADLGTVAQQAQVPYQKEALDEHNNRLIACETVLRNLQSRYDNLSTADLAKSMVNQMQTMYPYPVTVFNQIEQLARSYALSLQSLANLSADVGKLSQRLDTTVVSSKSNSVSNGSAVNSDTEKPSGNQQLVLFDDRLKSLSADLEDKFPRLETSLKLLTDRVEGDSGKLQAIANTIGVAKKQYETTVESLKSDLSRLETETAQKAGTADVEAMRERMNLDNAAILKRLAEKEEITIKDLASLHGQMTLVNYRLGISQQNRDHEDTRQDSSEEQIVVAAPKATSSVQKLVMSDSEDDNIPLAKNSGRSLHKGKRAAKRMRSESDDSDYELGRRR
ncbi:hypothetical protein MMC27_001462 [Xylographa pallens]|nr:hypothetical protein [Xylographa pallens]